MSLEENIRALERAPILADIGRDALRLLAFSAETQTLPAGAKLFDRNAAADTAFMVVSGRIKLDAGGGQIRMVGPGALIGEMALIVPTQRQCDALAADPARVLVIPRQLFRRMLEEFPQIAAVLRERLLERLRAEHEELSRIQESLDNLPGRR